MILNFKSILMLVAFSGILLACKKNANTPEPETKTTTTPTSPTSNGGDGSGGMFSVTNLYDENNSTLVRDSGGGCSAQPITNPLQSSIGYVTLNGDTLDFLFGAYMPQMPITSPRLPTYGSTITWKVTGGSDFGAFTYTTAKPMPRVGFLNLGFTSISKSSNLVFNHGLISCDSIKYQITDDSGHSFSKTVVGNISGYTIPSSMLSSLVNTNNGVVQVLAYSYCFSTQGGKNIMFVNSSGYTRQEMPITN